jgi:hypothetical protein
MERESFENEATAALLNEHFVSIKVDREERPDLDQLYQTVVQLLRQSGGWPLTVFLTPERRPFYAGTYFPPERRYGMPSFREILENVRSAYATQRADVALQADEITRAIAEVSEVGAGRGAPYSPGPDLLPRTARYLSSRFDEEHGGFGKKPKFPNTMPLDVLLRYAHESRDGQSEARVRRALDGMRAGGIFDQLGGGFHRYSTDEKWLVPHFEKMLYDNALLLRLYTDAGRALDASGYLAVARAVAGYLLREMQSPAGAFHATQDADSEGEEGRFFVWTPAQIDAVVADEKAREAIKWHLGVTERGNFEQTGATVLSEALSLDRVALKMSLGPSEIERLIDGAKEALFSAREARIKPFRDEKMLACWNGLAIGALAELGAVTGERALVDAAARAFAHLESELVEGGRVARFLVIEGGEKKIARPGFLDDHADLAGAALDLYEATGEPRYVAVARRIAGEIREKFMSSAGDAFHYSPADGEALIVRTSDPYDQATPSGAAMAALLFLRLASLGAAELERPAAAYLEKAAAAAVENPFGMGQTVCALHRLVKGAVEVVIVGAAADPATEALRREVFAAYLPNRSLALVDPADPASLAAAGPLAEGKPAHDVPVAYVCRDRACSAPVRTPSELRALLRGRA